MRLSLGVAFGGGQLGNTAALLTEHSGMQGKPVRRVENACASSGFALRDAWMAIKSGQADVVVAGGIEKMNDLTRAQAIWEYRVIQNGND